MTTLREASLPEAFLPASPVQRRSLVSRPSAADSVFRRVSYAAGAATVGILLAVGFFLSMRGAQALGVAKWHFLTEEQWVPESGAFGIRAVLFGTISIAVIAMFVAFPLAFGTALLLSDIVSERVGRRLVPLVDLMAAVPSILYGLWGFYFLQSQLVPVAQWLSETVGRVLPVFAVTDADGNRVSDTNAYTSTAFLAGIVVGFMAVPTMTSIMREAFSRAPVGEREGAYALGATRWGMIRAVVLPFGKGGIIGGTMLGLGRALGETIAVAMIISPVFGINWQVLKSGTNSVSALIALQYSEASQFGLSALMAAGLALFALTLVVNFTASSIVARSRSGAESEG
jgi:phosphate transport system permease protein